MKYVGAHVSASPGVAASPVNAHNIGAKAFALFTRNPSRWASKPLTAADIDGFRQGCELHGYTPAQILPHDSYLINLGSPDKEKNRMSLEAFLDELHRCSQLGLTMLNFHPGSHVNEIGIDNCLDLIAANINRALDSSTGVKAVIENTAGQGSNLGHTFEQIAHIIDRVDDKERVGVCIDTCHTFAAGYELSTPQGYEDTWQQFGQIIGWQYLSAIHLNDSKKGVGSKVDRHAPLCQGTIGEQFFSLLMNDPRLDNIPIILETPDPSIWQKEIEWLYSLCTTANN